MPESPLDQPVRAIASHEVVFADRADTLRKLAEKMAADSCSALLLEQRSGDLAIVTEHDIVAALAGGADADVEWAVDVMTSEVQMVTPSTSVAEAAELMQLMGIRHLVVGGESDRLGILSIRDLLEPLLSIAD